MQEGSTGQSAPGASAAPAGKGPGTADDRATAFKPVEGGTEMQSGEKLMVEAYAAIWLVVVMFVVSMFRRQRELDRRIATLDAALAKAQSADKSGS